MGIGRATFRLFTTRLVLLNIQGTPTEVQWVGYYISDDVEKLYVNAVVDNRNMPESSRKKQMPSGDDYS